MNVDAVHVGRRPHRMRRGDHVVVQHLHRQPHREEDAARAGGDRRAAVQARAALPQPAAEVAHGTRHDLAVRVLGKAGEASAQHVDGGGRLRLERRDPAVAAAAQRDVHAQPVRQRQVVLAGRMRHRRRAGRMPHHVHEAARPRVAAHGHAQRGIAGILARAAGHLDGLLHLVVIVEVERRERQHERVNGAGVCRDSRSRRLRRIQQRELSGRMAQLRGHLAHGLGEALAVAAVAQFLLVLQHRQRDGHGGDGQQQEHAAEEQAQAEEREAGPAPGGQARAPGRGRDAHFSGPSPSASPAT